MRKVSVIGVIDMHRVYPIYALILVMLIVYPIIQIQVVSASFQNNHTDTSRDTSYCLGIRSHLWKEMVQVLIDKLYDSNIGLFRETWGTREGRCWHWNTEQGEALLALSYLNNTTINKLKSQVLESYYNILTYRGDGHIWLFSRYVSCRGFRILPLDPSNFSIGNFVINIGGDLAGTRESSSPYSRAIALAIDTYKDTSSLSEKSAAWPINMYVANIRSIEVYYGLKRESSSYKGIWDTGDGGLGSGKIASYNISISNDHAIAYRVMKDNMLSIIQSLTLTPGSSYVDINMTVHNNWNYTLYNVRVTLPFDNLDWWGYDTIYVPGKGYFYASEIGHPINNNEKEYLIIDYNDTSWTAVNGWKPSIVYSREPLGINRALIVLVDSNTSIKLWGYGNIVGNDSTWYYRWIKYEIGFGDLEPGQAKTVKFRVYPLASYPSGLEKLAISLATNPEDVYGRDLNYAVNTGTGAFYGLVRADPNDPRTMLIIEDAGYLFKLNNWNASTRILANYLLALIELYNITNNETYLDQANKLASILINRQVRDESSPLDGGFLDYPRPWGKGTYLDVGVEVAKALLKLYSLTGNTSYKESVDYWLGKRFHKDTNGSWYYHEIQLANSTNTVKKHLESEPSYALGYLVAGLASYYLTSPIVLSSISILWDRITQEYWIPATYKSEETNVEAQASAILASKTFLEASLYDIGIGIEYVKGGMINNLNYDSIGDYSIVEFKFVKSGLIIQVVFYINKDSVLEIIMPPNVTKVEALETVCGSAYNRYYYDSSNGFLFISLGSNYLTLKHSSIKNVITSNERTINYTLITQGTDTKQSMYSVGVRILCCLLLALIITILVYSRTRYK